MIYPGLSSHPQHDIAKRQQHGFGAMITFYCIGGKRQSELILQNVSSRLIVMSCFDRELISHCIECPSPNEIIQLNIFALAESLGAVESLAECPAVMTHASVPDEQRALLGIDDTLIRLSIGIESCQDLIDDLDVALNYVLEETPQP